MIKQLCTSFLGASVTLTGAAFALNPTPASAQNLPAHTTGHWAHLVYASESLSSSSNSSSALSGDVSDPAPLAPEPADKASGGIHRPISPRVSGIRPFSGVAVAVKVGSAGIGFDVATPLAQRFNLRSGASFFSYNTSLTQDGLNITGAIKLQNASVSVDIFPFNNSFRISPGVTFHNFNNLGATLLVPAGQNFSLGNGDYTSSPTDPIHGTAAFNFGSNFAPRLTMGFGNMLPRKGGRFSVPTEVGFQYIAQPTVALSIAGSSCGSQTQSDGTTGYGCGPVDQANVVQEQNQLQDALSPLRFYPIVSIGVSYRLGHIHRGE